MIRSLFFCGFLCLATVSLLVLILDGNGKADSALKNIRPAQKELVRELGLTDLAIWSEARYSRHPSQADFFTAFQDYPGAFDHFPAGSIISPRQMQDVSFLRFKKKGQP